MEPSCIAACVWPTLEVNGECVGPIEPTRDEYSHVLSSVHICSLDRCCFSPVTPVDQSKTRPLNSCLITAYTSTHELTV